MNKREEVRAVRRRTDLTSVKALAKLLRNVAAEPEAFLEDVALRNALKSQGALAKHAIPGASILAMSLNHQRVISEICLGGYSVLDSLRRAARDALDSERVRRKRGNARSKDGLLARVRELTSDVALLKQDLAILQRAYDLRCVQARAYAAEANAVVRALCAKEQRELDSSFSLLKKPVVPTNVVAIEEARKSARHRK